jgi:diketogulonate reductase-like aldo/keto reductase
VIELEFHPYLLSHLQPVLDIHAKHGIVAEAYGPLTPLLRHPGGPLKPVLTKLAKKYDTDEATVLLRWTIQYGVVAVTSSKNEERIKGYYKLWEFELTPEEVKEIEETGRKVHFRWYDVSTRSSWVEVYKDDGLTMNRSTWSITSLYPTCQMVVRMESLSRRESRYMQYVRRDLCMHAACVC